ncbi:unnamed protein product [Linum tenue]|uniref:Uncharacterized protein n=1 Tax=Linum tenue TaxID=586396 RepID=A0AAV0PK15_9ROSI|nr:unnamed protein product [Linum tenue]
MLLLLENTNLIGLSFRGSQGGELDDGIAKNFKDEFQIQGQATKSAASKRCFYKTCRLLSLTHGTECC